MNIIEILHINPLAVPYLQIEEKNFILLIFFCNTLTQPVIGAFWSNFYDELINVFQHFRINVKITKQQDSLI